MVYRGFVRNGRVELENGDELPEGAEVRVELLPTSKLFSASTVEPLGRRLARHAGTATGLPPDMSTHHDHYLYGTPKH
jgi:hypothetical protein